MLTAVSALIGLGGSLIPEIVGIFKKKEDDKQKLKLMEMDYKQELLVLDKQAKLAEQGHKFKMDEDLLRYDQIEMSGDIEMNLATIKSGTQIEGANWVKSLNASVRPVITYSFFIFFCIANLAPVFDPSLLETVKQVYSDEIHSLFVSIMCFHFGNRSIHHVNRRK